MFSDEDHVRTLLTTTDIPPSGVEIATVMQQGHRSVVRRRIASTAGGVALAATLVAVVAVPYALRSQSGPTKSVAAGGPKSPAVTTPLLDPTGTATVTCTPTALKAGKGAPSDVGLSAVSPNGRYIAGMQSSDTVYKAVLYTDGTSKPLSVEGTVEEIDAVSSDGTVVGITSLDGFTNEHVFRYKNGSTTILQYPMSGLWHPFEVHMNASGAIVAQAEPSGASGGGRGTANLLWHPGSKTAVKLPLPDGSGLTGITDNGDITGGGVQHADGTVGDAMVWDSTGHNGKLLPVPPGESGIAQLSGGNFAAGGTFQAGSDVNWDHMVTWNVVTGAEKGYPASGPPSYVNARGDIVGDLPSGAGVTFADGTTAILQPLKAGQQTYATLISDTGNVIGVSGSTATTWRC